MVNVHFKDGNVTAYPEEAIPNVKRLFYGEIKKFETVEQASNQKVVIGSSKADLQPKGKRRATN